MILKAAIDDPDLEASERTDMLLVLHTIVCAREPLTIGALSGLLKLNDDESVDSALSPLWSVLHIMEDNRKVTTLHASFPDYMLDRNRSREYHCSEDEHNRALARLCFECIDRTEPRFNIGALASSYLLDQEVPNLAERIQSTISTELFYACRRWAEHLPSVTDLSIGNILEHFLGRNLLLWMEILNLKRCIHLGTEIMCRAEGWCIRQKLPDSLIDLAHDAWRYVMAFSSGNGRQSTPHIYISALPFWPNRSPISNLYARNLRGLIRPAGPALNQRQSLILATWKFDEPIHCALFSPNTTQIALAVGRSLLLVDSINGQPILDPFVGHSGDITSLGYSPDGTLIASGSKDQTVRMWDSQSGQLTIDPLKGHTKEVTCIGFSPDGACIATGSYDRSIRLWDVRTGTPIPGMFEAPSWVTVVRFSPNGKNIVSGLSDSTLRVWDMASRQNILVLRGHSSRVTSVEFSSDGGRLVSGSYDKTVRVWDVHRGKRIGSSLKGHSGRITGIAISSDGRHVASGSEDRSIRIWNLETGEMVLGPLEMHTDMVNSVAFSARGGHLISTSQDMTLKVWDIRSKQTTFSISTRQKEESCEPSMSQTSEEHMGPTRTSEFGSVPDPVHPEGHTGGVNSIAVSPNGTRVVSGSDDNTIRVWDSQSGCAVLGPLRGHIDRVNSVAFSPDGTHIISGSKDNTIRVWGSQTGFAVLGPFQGHISAVTSVAVSPDGSRIISGSDDTTIRVWDSQTGLTVLSPLQGHTGGVTSVAVSPDGSRIASGSHDKTVCVWDSQTGLIALGPLQGHSFSVLSVAFSPDGSRIVSGAFDNTIRIWNLQTGLTELGTLQGHTHWVNSVAFSPDGTRIISGSDDNTIRVWDSQTGLTVLGPLQAHTHWVNSVAFFPDGSRIVSGSSDCSVILWDALEKATSMRANDQLTQLPSLPVIYPSPRTGSAKPDGSIHLVH